MLRVTSMKLIRENSSLADDLLNESRLLLDVALPPNVMAIPTGAVSLILNVITVIVIARSKTLRTKCFILLAANSCGDGLVGLAYLVTGSLRTYRYARGQGEIVDTWHCCWELSVLIFAQVLSLSINIALVIERVLATFCPIRYKIWTYKQLTFPLVLASIAMALGQTTAHLANSWAYRDRVLTTCGVEDTLSLPMSSIVTALQILMSGAIIILHGVLAYGVRKQKLKYKGMTSSGSFGGGSSSIMATNVIVRREMAKLESDMKFLKAVSAIVITQTVVMAVRFVLGMMDVFSDDVARILANRYGGQIVVMSSTIDFFSLLIMSSQFRHAAKRTFKVGMNVVSITNDQAET